MLIPTTYRVCFKVCSRPLLPLSPNYQQSKKRNGSCIKRYQPFLSRAIIQRQSPAIPKSLYHIRQIGKIDHRCGSLLNLLRFLDEGSQSCFEEAPETDKITVGEAAALVQTLISHSTCTAQLSKDWTELLHRRAQQ